MHHLHLQLSVMGMLLVVAAISCNKGTLPLILAWLLGLGRSAPLWRRWGRWGPCLHIHGRHVELSSPEHLNGLPAHGLAAGCTGN